jgi:hypothetical protein
MAVLRLARSRLSFSCTESLVFFTSRRFTDICDMNSLHGEKRFGTSWSTWSPSMVNESGTSGTGERSVVIPTLIASPSMLSTSEDLTLVRRNTLPDPPQVPSDDQRGGSEGSRSVAQTDDYLFELRHEAQLRPGAERSRLFRRARRRRAAQRLSAREAAGA